MQTQFTSEQLTDPGTAASEKEIRKCVHCGFCTATCPTYVLLGDELDSPRGRIYLMKDMLENERAPSAEVVKHVDRCLSCLSCQTTCPSGVTYSHLVDHSRAYIEANYKRPLMDRTLRTLLAAILPYPRRFRVALALARPFKGLAGLVGRIPALEPVAAMLALAPPVKRQTAKPMAEPILVGASRGRVAVMQGCAESVLDPGIRAAATRLLARCGFEPVLVRGESCCGGLAHHMGREASAMDTARRTIDAWIAEIDGPGLTAIVATASGCGSVIKDYGHMFRADPAYAEKAARVAALTRDVVELVERAGLPPVADHPALNVAYHSSCSLQHGQKIRLQPKQLLQAAGFTVSEPADSHLCCGSAGVYNILQPRIAGQLGDRKTASLEVLKPDVIAAGNIGCLTQIDARTDIPVLHTVELLDWATGGPRPAALGPHVIKAKRNDP